MFIRVVKFRDSKDALLFTKDIEHHGTLVRHPKLSFVIIDPSDSKTPLVVKE